MCNGIGYKVLALHRSKIGNVGVKDLRLGNFRYLTTKEVDSILFQIFKKCINDKAELRPKSSELINDLIFFIRENNTNFNKFNDYCVSSFYDIML